MDDEGHRTFDLMDMKKTYEIIISCPHEIIKTLMESIESVLKRPGR